MSENPLYRRLYAHRSALEAIQLLAVEQRNLLRGQLEKAPLDKVQALQGEIAAQTWWSNIISRVDSAIESTGAKKDG